MDRRDESPNTRAMHLRSAMEHLENRSWRLAESQCRILLAIDAADVEGMLLLGLSIAASGEAARAAPTLGRVRRLRPDHADPCRDLSTMQPRVPKTMVTRQYRACLRLAPTDTRLRLDFAHYLLENGDAATALTVLRDAPDSSDAFNMRGMALAEAGKFKDAIRAFESAIRIDPEAPGNWANLATMLRIEGKFDESVAAYDRATARDESDARIKVNRAIALLHAGKWEEAWPEYESRFLRPGYTPVSDAPLLPSLAPGARLDGTRILVWHEEGFGDTLQFTRYLPLLARLGAEVTAVVPAPLVRLLRGIPEIAVLRAGEGALPPHDAHCPFFSLPRVFGTTTRDVPNAPYLTADPALTATWAARLPKGNLSVGLVWAGQARPWLQGFGSVDRRRSAGLAAFAPLATVRGVNFVSLQAGTPAAQEPPEGLMAIDPMQAVRDFADTAAIIANLDAVISVDTSVAHLAGAMGKPVFLLDRYDNCWRWLHGRADSPWYPSMTIFRQPRPGDWVTPMHRAAASLAALAIFRGGQIAPASELANAA